MKSHNPTDEQIKAFKAVVRAFKKANKLGLRIYGKCYDIVAYTKEADNYIDEEDFNESLGTGFGEIPHLSASVLADSGADDYAKYRSQSDEYKFNDE